MTKQVTHQCQICQKNILCDLEVISYHIMNEHNLTIGDYKNQFPATRPKTEKAASFIGGSKLRSPNKKESGDEAGKETQAQDYEAVTAYFGNLCR